MLIFPKETRAADAPPKKATSHDNALSLSLVQDLGLHADTDVCSPSSQLHGDYACFRDSGTQYHGTPLAMRGGEVRPGVQLSTTRVLVGYDRVVFDNITLGLRLGWVLRGGGPRPSGAEAPAFLPFHGEVRAGYTFGARPFARPGFRGSLFVFGGIAQFDTEYRVVVEEDTTKPPPASQLDNPPSQTLSAYRKSGTGFVGLGVAATYAFSPSLALSAALKFTKPFPSTGTLLSPELSFSYAF
ncbi:hypothetical protein [Polyangium sp. y55x31]|uniref:hypothetical protein n=1 Tax=Polyangium sp. y55x31 TaxID=3042688 RepID=UPI0024827C3F|nr:hypothetical protein [Polyangium sp. y55x31]MDI1484260.1 hypothetical protein [Polyangium sp. y55x31]